VIEIRIIAIYFFIPNFARLFQIFCANCFARKWVYECLLFGFNKRPIFI